MTVKYLKETEEGKAFRREQEIRKKLKKGQTYQEGKIYQGMDGRATAIVDTYYSPTSTTKTKTIISGTPQAPSTPEIKRNETLIPAVTSSPEIRKEQRVEITLNKKGQTQSVSTPESRATQLEIQKRQTYIPQRQGLQETKRDEPKEITQFNRQQYKTDFKSSPQSFSEKQLYTSDIEQVKGLKDISLNRENIDVFGNIIESKERLSKRETGYGFAGLERTPTSFESVLKPESEKLREYKFREEEKQALAFVTGAAIAFTGGAILPALPGLVQGGAAIAGLGYGAYETGRFGADVLRYKKEGKKQALGYRTAEFGAGTFGAVVGGFSGSKVGQALKVKLEKPTFEITRSTEPIIVRKGQEQTLFTKQFTELYRGKTPPKVEDRLGITFKQTKSTNFGTEEAYFRKIETKTGKGFYEPKTKTFIETDVKTILEKPSPEDFLPSKSKYVISSRPQEIITKTKLGDIREPYTKYKISKTIDVNEPISTAKETNIRSVTKGEFYKLSKSLVLYEEPKVKGFARQNFKISPSKDLVISSTKSSTGGYETKSGSSFFQQETIKPTVAKIEAKQYAPITKVTKLKSREPLSFTTLFTKKEPTIIETTQYVSEKPITEYKFERQIRTESQIKNTYNPEVRTETINILKSEPIRKTSQITNIERATERKTESILGFRTAQTSQQTLKTDTQLSQKLLSTTSRPLRTRLPTKTKLRTPPILPPLKLPKFTGKNQGFNLFAGFGVKVKRKGKYRTLFTGLTQSEAIRAGQRYTDVNTSRTFKIFKSGAVKREKGGVVDLFRYRRSKRDPFAFVEKSKFAISTGGEKKELRQAKNRWF